MHDSKQWTTYFFLDTSRAFRDLECCVSVEIQSTKTNSKERILIVCILQTYPQLAN